MLHQQQFEKRRTDFTCIGGAVCDDGEFLCADGRVCVSASWVCDGEADCPDSSDETLHQCSQQVVCPLNHMQCVGSHRCVPFSKVCDGVADCEDGYDEGVHCRELVRSCSEHRCEFGCVKLRTGAECYCGSGLELQEDRRTCRDHDECGDYGTCSQICMNTLGSYRCSCADGFSLQANRRSCKAKTDPGDRPPMLLIANQNSLSVSYLNGSSVTNMKAVDVNGTQTLDFIHRDETLCWLQTSRSAGQLWCAKLTKQKGISEKRQIRIPQDLQSEYTQLFSPLAVYHYNRVS
uniref:EGF-like domain-containing protein n=1 Tax=Astyanax mexicanus TaxID=7994 RepID=A0A8B9L9Z0_ASTMX